MLCMPTLKFTTLSNVESTLPYFQLQVHNFGERQSNVVNTTRYKKLKNQHIFEHIFLNVIKQLFRRLVKCPCYYVLTNFLNTFQRHIVRGIKSRIRLFIIFVASCQFFLITTSRYAL